MRTHFFRVRLYVKFGTIIRQVNSTAFHLYRCQQRTIGVLYCRQEIYPGKIHDEP